MKRIILFAVFLLAPLLIHAQQTSAPAQQSAVTEQRPSREEILQLFETMRIQKQCERMQKTMIAQLEPMLENTMKDEMKDLTLEQRSKLNSIMNSYVKESLNIYPVAEMLNDMVPAYQSNLSRDDVQAISSFYKSPAGQTFLDKSPKLMQDAMDSVAPKMQERMRKSIESMMKQVSEMFAVPEGGKAPANKHEEKQQ